MGCLRRVVTGVGCLAVLLAAAVAGFIYRDRLAHFSRRLRGIPEPPPAVYVRPAAGGAVRAEAALRDLARHGGPAYVDVAAADLAALLDRELGRAPGRVFDSVAVALGDQRVLVKGSLDVTVLPKRLLGPLAEGLGRREPVVAGGTLSVTPEGQVLWLIDALKIREFPFPRAVIPAVIGTFGLTEAHDAAVPVPLPAAAGDIRVRASGVRIYRASER